MVVTVTITRTQELVKGGRCRKSAGTSTVYWDHYGYGPGDGNANDTNNLLWFWSAGTLGLLRNAAWKGGHIPCRLAKAFAPKHHRYTSVAVVVNICVSIARRFRIHHGLVIAPNEAQ